MGRPVRSERAPPPSLISSQKPQAAVDMHLSVVEAKLSQKDYATIMATLSGNLAEKVR